jgi:hypothetical protein
MIYKNGKSLLILINIKKITNNLNDILKYFVGESLFIIMTQRM